MAKEKLKKKRKKKGMSKKLMSLEWNSSIKLWTKFSCRKYNSKEYLWSFFSPYIWYQRMEKNYTFKESIHSNWFDCQDSREGHQIRIWQPKSLDHITIFTNKVTFIHSRAFPSGQDTKRSYKNVVLKLLHKTNQEL